MFRHTCIVGDRLWVELVLCRRDWPADRRAIREARSLSE